MMKKYDFNESIYFYKQAAAGQPTYVFFPGFGGDTTYFNFKNIIKQLPNDIGVLAIDTLGYGYSETDLPRTFENINHNYTEIINLKLNISKLILVGHSQGCIYLLQYAQVNQVRISDIFLIEPPHYGIERLLNMEKEAVYKQVQQIEELKVQGEISYLDLVENVNPQSSEEDRLENAKVLFKAYGNQAMMTEIENLGSGLWELEQNVTKLLPRLTLICTNERLVEYEQSNYKDCREIVALIGTHYLHWSNEEGLLQVLA